MATELFDNATSPGTSTALTEPIDDLTTTLPVIEPASVVLQEPGQFRVVVINPTSGEQELMLVTGNQWTSRWDVVRGIENTTPISFPQGALVRHIITAGALRKVLQDYAASIPQGPPGLLSPVVASEIPGNYTLQLPDAGRVLEAMSAVAVTFTIPPHADVPFPFGPSACTVIEAFQYGTGQITIAGGAGVTLESNGQRVKTAAQYSSIGLRQRAQDVWVLSGDLA